MSSHDKIAEIALFEIRRIGNSARVACVDPQTGIEAIAIAPANTAQSTLKALGLAKLRYQLEKQAKKNS